MKIIVREKADADLDHIFRWIAQNNPRAATDMIRRIRARIGKLETPSLSRMGRPGLEAGTRELVEPLISSSTRCTKHKARSISSMSSMARKIELLVPIDLGHGLSRRRLLLKAPSSRA